MYTYIGEPMYVCVGAHRVLQRVTECFSCVVFVHVWMHMHAHACVRACVRACLDFD